jgi:hypothetical protein
MALAESLGQPRAPKEGETAAEPQQLPELPAKQKPAPFQLRLPGF